MKIEKGRLKIRVYAILLLLPPFLSSHLLILLHSFGNQNQAKLVLQDAIEINNNSVNSL